MSKFPAVGGRETNTPSTAVELRLETLDYLLWKTQLVGMEVQRGGMSEDRAREYLRQLVLELCDVWLP
jgi:hypothetical protein